MGEIAPAKVKMRRSPGCPGAPARCARRQQRAASLADHQLWLVLGETPPLELVDLLHEHCDPWPTLTYAADQWRRVPATGKNAARLRIPVLTGRTSSDEARQTVVESLGGLRPALRRTAEDAYTRATVQSAITALHALRLTDEDFLACLRLRELATDGSELRLRDRTIPVPAHLRRALVGQRLHASVIGQRPDDQLPTFDESVSRPSPGIDPPRRRHHPGGAVTDTPDPGTSTTCGLPLQGMSEGVR